MKTVISQFQSGLGETGIVKLLINAFCVMGREHENTTDNLLATVQQDIQSLPSYISGLQQIERGYL